jgi:hypothetical protein
MVTAQEIAQFLPHWLQRRDISESVRNSLTSKKEGNRLVYSATYLGVYFSWSAHSIFTDSALSPAKCAEDIAKQIAAPSAGPLESMTADEVVFALAEAIGCETSGSNNIFS